MLLSNRFLEWILNPRYRWVQHLLFWSIMYMPHLAGYLGFTQAAPPELLPVYFAVFCLDATVVYSNLYILIPRFFLKGQYWTYVLLTLAMLVANATFGPVVQQWVMTGERVFKPEASAIIESFVLTFNLLMTAVGFNIIKRFLVSQAKLKELETSSLKAELAYLKHQINPHFLFNSLNNIYVQGRTAPTEASESILQLSDLLRYQLYDCAKEKVNLSDEIEYLQNYLDLEKMRKNKATIEFTVNGTPSGITVAPFLFIPFVENALKHGINLNNETRIRVHFDIRPEQVVFEIENPKPALALNNVKGGIGLANISRRLDLLYPGKYSLDIDDQSKQYRVRLAFEP